MAKSKSSGGFIFLTLLIAGGGDNCVRLLPPLNLTLDEAREVITRFEATCLRARKAAAA